MVTPPDPGIIILACDFDHVTPCPGILKAHTHTQRAAYERTHNSLSMSPITVQYPGLSARRCPDPGSRGIRIVSRDRHRNHIKVASPPPARNIIVEISKFRASCGAFQAINSRKVQNPISRPSTVTGLAPALFF